MRRRTDEADAPPPEPPADLAVFDYPTYQHLEEDEWRAVYAEWLARRNRWEAEHGVTLPVADELFDPDWV